MRRFIPLLFFLLTSFPVLSAETPEYSLQIIDVHGPSRLEIGEEAEFRLLIRNNGSIPWDSAEGFALGAHWRKPDNSVLKWDGPRTPFPHPIGPEEEIHITAGCIAPGCSGTVILEWDIVKEGLLWISEKMEKRPPGRVIEILPPPSFSIIHRENILGAPAKSSREISLKIRNTGGTTWNNEISLASHWESPDGCKEIREGPRTQINGPVKPGEDLNITARIDVPANTGRWLLSWDMVRENHYWFSEVMAVMNRSQVFIVLPRWAVAWPALAMEVLLLLFLLGVRRRWWPGFRAASHVDLIWLVLVGILVEIHVLPGPETWWTSLILLITLGLVLNLLPEKIRPPITFVGGSLLICLLLIDRIYLRFFGDLPSLGSLSMLGQTDEISSSIRSLIQSSDLALALTIPLGLFVIFLRKKEERRNPLFLRFARAGLGILAAASLLVFLQHQPAVSQVFRRARVAEFTGVSAAHCLDTVSWIHRKILRTPISSARIRKITEYFRSTEENRAGVSPFFGAARNLNLVLIQVESLQEFMLGLEIDHQAVMPTLQRWASEGIHFTGITDQTGLGRSSDAELLSQTSLLPLPDGAAAFSCASNHYVSPAGLARAEGYHTLSAVPFDPSFWNRRENHRAYGYQRSLFAPDFAPGRIIGWGLNDRDFLSQMAQRLEKLPQPFLAWMITLSLHHPFEGFPDDLQEINTGSWEGTPVGEYIHTMRYLDHALGDFEAELRASGLWDHTVIMLFGDHDAGFEWTPEIAALMGVTPDDLGWYRSQKIPLLLHFPAGLLPEEDLALISRNQPAGHADIPPTAAALLGIDPKTLPWLGHNLLGKPSNEPVIGEYGCFTDQDHIFLQGEDGRLESGRCYERETLRSLSPESCREAFLQARKIERISREILRKDLQNKIRKLIAR